MKRMFGLKSLVALMLFCIAGSTSAAALFSIGQKGITDIQTQQLSVNYTYNTATSNGNFNITGNSVFQNYESVIGSNDSFLGNFSLGFDVNSSGNLIAGTGSFLITNVLNLFGGTTPLGNLLSGTVVDFGFTNTSFEVLLDITTGALLGNFGTLPGAIVSGDFSSFSFASSQVFSGNAADTFNVNATPVPDNAIPEPSILVLVMLAGLGAFSMRKFQC